MYNRDLGVALEHLLAGTHLRDCGAWLKGHELPEAAAGLAGAFHAAGG